MSMCGHILCEKRTGTCSSGDRAMVSGTMWRGFESLQVRFFTEDYPPQHMEVRVLGSFREWLSDNLRYILLGLAIILVLVIAVFVVKLAGGHGGKDGRNQSESRNVVVETNSESDTKTEKESEEPLTENDASVLEAVQKYYTAMGNKDMETLEGMVESLTDAEKQKIQSLIIESYNNIAVYSKSGKTADSYVVYAYYEAKIADIEELVPSLACLYLKKNEAGSFYIADWKADKEVSDYVAEVNQDSDVQALILRVDEEYKEMVSNNEQLGEIVKELDQPETEITIPDVSGSDVQVNQVVEATDVLNVRSDSREDAERIGILDVGEQVTRVKVLDNGWAEIKYGEATGYVLNEYLKDVSQ